MKRLIHILLFTLAFAGVVLVQYFYDNEKDRARFFEPLVLKPEVLRAANLGLDNAAADLEWLAAIQYFGGGESETYEKLDDYLELSTELDPKFAYPYAFGALILPGVNQLDKGIEIAKKGVENQVKDWRIAYYLATTYHINKEDSTNAAKYFDIAANTPGAPENIKKVAASYGSRKDLRSKTKQIWVGIYESSKDEMVKERAKKYIIHFEILDLLDAASEIYFKQTGKHPTKIEDLVNAKIITGTPTDPFGLSFEFNQEGKLITK